MKPEKNIFYTRKISKNEYIVYNSRKHIPIKLDNIGKKYFDIILKYNSKCECLQNISCTEHTDFKYFYSTLKKINFLSNIEEHINKSIMFNKFEETNKVFYIHLTDRCNLKCTYCYNKEQRTNKKDLNFESWKIIIDGITPYANRIILTGGEVLLHKSFKNIICYIKNKNKNISISLITNGCLNYEQLNLGPTFHYLDKIEMSCDNIKDNRHERIGFNREMFLQNINFIRGLNFKNKITIASVWTKEGTENIKHLDNFCKENELEFSRTICIPHSNEALEMMPLVKEHYNYLKNNINESVEKNKKITCSAASNTFSIDARGDCFPCQSFRFPSYKLGNLFHENFKKIYYSPIATMLRMANDVNNKEKCKECNLKYLCGGGCIADTFEMEGSILAHPKIMCPYYKNGAILNLQNIAYE